MLNKIFIMGRLTRDPELRRTQSGTAVTSFSLAVDRDFKSQSGEKETDFIDVVAWRSTAEFVAKYFTKGRMAVVEGRLQIRDWKDREGNNRRSAEVIADNVYFGDSKRDGAGDGLRKLRRGGGLAVAGKRDYIGQLALGCHLAQLYLERVEYHGSYVVRLMAGALNVETVFAVNAVERADFAAGRHHVDAERKAQATAANGPKDGAGI